MSRSRIRLHVAVVTFIMLPAATGVLAVHASATCERFVRNYVTRPVRNEVSKTTEEAWARWREQHPNWRPNPAVHRPKYVMTRDESIQKVNFACSVETLPAQAELVFPPDPGVPPPMIDVPFMTSTQTTIPTIPSVTTQVLDTWPPTAAIVPPALNGPLPELALNAPPPLVGGTPEPSSLLLAGTGLGLLLAAGMRRRSPQIEAV